MRPLLGQSEAALAQWRETLRDALGQNGALMANLVPELEFVLGKQPLVSGLSPQETQKRFQMVVRRFVGVFARAEHPLVLFLNDLQWLDAATLETLEQLVTHKEMRYLLLIGAYRNNEVSPNDPLMRTLEEMRPKVPVHELVLAPLALQDIMRLMADSFRCDIERTRYLARLLQEKTAGNPFFVTQFIQALVEEGLIAFDRSNGWSWDIARIRAKRFADNVVDLMVAKLTGLPAETQGMLKLLASVGNAVETATLARIQGEPDAAVDAQLWEAERAGFVFRLEGSYVFAHDRIQEAAYSLIPREERAAGHLRIGGCLVAALEEREFDEQIFDVVNHFNLGAALLSDRNEIELVDGLDLRAGRKERAECALLSSRFEEAKALIVELLGRADLRSTKPPCIG